MPDKIRPSSLGEHAKTGPVDDRPIGTAIAALVLGICAMIIPGLGFFTGIVGIIIGIVALSQIAQTKKKGKTMAIAGIALSALGIILHVIVFILLINFTQDMIDDPTAALKKLPGVQGCNIEEPVICDAYDIDGNTVTLTLSADEAGTVSGIEGMIIKDGASMEELAAVNETEPCTWEGSEQLTETPQDFAVICPEIVGSDDIFLFSIDYDGVLDNSADGLIIP